MAKTAPIASSSVKVSVKKAAAVVTSSATPVQNGAATSNGARRASSSVSVGAMGGATMDSMSSVNKWLLDRTDIERMNPSRVQHDMFKLERMHELMRVLGNPHEAFQSVHIGGTKGKGSTCEMTAAALEACGYTVGLYTSPHLMDVRERIRINRQLISAADFIRTAQRVAEGVAKLPAEMGEPTYFELITAMGLVYFADQAVDIGVIEVGLGGRLDSTNVIRPEVSAITSISRDHWQILGDSLEKIAREKAGIFKKGVPAITVPQPVGGEPVIETLRHAATQAGASLAVIGTDIEFSVRFEATPALGPHLRVCLTTPRNAFEHIPVPLRGEHQAYNCGLALAILDRLSERGFKVPENKVVKGLASVSLAGRMEILPTIPRMLLDGAHNADSMQCLMKAIGAQVKYDSMVVIFGCAADKDIDGMLKQVALGADKVIFTKTTGSTRAADPKDLARRFEDEGKMCQVAEDFAGALALARRAVSRDDLICVTGSLHLVGEAKKVVAAMAAK